MRKRLPHVITAGAIVCIIVTAALAVGSGAARGDGGGASAVGWGVAILSTDSDVLSPSTRVSERSRRSGSCFWSRGKVKWCLVLKCLANPPKGWSRQGCGYVRDGRAIPASRNALRIYTKGRMVGSARGPGAVAVAAYKLVLGDM